MKNNIKIEKLCEFFEKAHKAVEECINAEFTCPICGGTAYAVKIEDNGHVHARCDKCHMNVMQ